MQVGTVAWPVLGQRWLHKHSIDYNVENSKRQIASLNGTSQLVFVTSYLDRDEVFIARVGISWESFEWQRRWFG